jgi:glycosyltransferase involved in cell wall biosynthesis
VRILHLVHQYLPDKAGGTEFYTHWLAHELNGRGHQVSIFYRRSQEGTGMARRQEDGVTVWAAWNGLLDPRRRLTATFADRPIAQAFEQVLAETRPELIHVQHLMGLPAVMLQSLAQQRIPYLITLWDFWWVCANAQLLTNYSQEICDGPQAFLNCARCALARNGRSQWFLPALPLLAAPLAWRNRLLRQVLAHAHRLIAPAAFVRDWYAAHGAPLDKIVVAPPGLDYPKEIARSTAERPFRVGYVGGLSWQKGVHILVEAFQGLPGAAELWLAGDTTFDPQYVTRLRQLSDSRVNFLGQLDRGALWPMLAQVDVVVAPSLWYETFCFVVSEAFAVGVPVIVSDLGVLAERVVDGQDGLLVPPGDVDALRAALIRLQQSPALLAHLRAGIPPVRTMADHLQDVLALYDQAVSA